jgi:hypothetical protein
MFVCIYLFFYFFIFLFFYFFIYFILFFLFLFFYFFIFLFFYFCLIVSFLCWLSDCIFRISKISQELSSFENDEESLFQQVTELMDADPRSIESLLPPIEKDWAIPASYARMASSASEVVVKELEKKAKRNRFVFSRTAEDSSSSPTTDAAAGLGHDLFAIPLLKDDNEEEEAVNTLLKKREQETLALKMTSLSWAESVLHNHSIETTSTTLSAEPADSVEPPPQDETTQDAVESLSNIW